MSEESSLDVTSLTVQLLSAYLSNNTVASSDLAGLIATTRAALLPPAAAAEPVAEQSYEAAVSIRKSLSSRDHIISMIDGKPYKMLKRHLIGNGLTPAEYRARYNLPADYPMVAPTYSERRREVAKSLGLGRKGRQVAAEIPDALAPAETEADVAKPTVKKLPKVKAVPEANSETKTAAKRGRPAKAKADTTTPQAVADDAVLKPAQVLKTALEPVAPEPVAPETVTPEIKAEIVKKDASPKRARTAKSAAETPAVTNAAKVAKKDPARKSAPKSGAKTKPVVEDAVPVAADETASKPAARRSKAGAETPQPAKAGRPRRMARASEDNPETIA